MKDFIQLKKDSILRIGIKDFDGNVMDKHLEFDLEDIELPLRLQECLDLHTKNLNYLKIQNANINKQKDSNSVGIISKNSKDKIKLLLEFYDREIKALDMFLGEGMTKYILNGRKCYIEMFDDIFDMIKPIMPKLEENFNDINDRIVKKYSQSNKKESNII